MFKKLLRDASPKNPKYVLSRVMADFTAQSPTELTVRKFLFILKTRLLVADTSRRIGCVRHAC